MDTLDQIQKLADGLYLTSDPDELGRLDRAIRTLTAIKRSSLAELEEPKTGAEYRVVTTNAAKRSYNTAAIISRFDRKNWTLNDLLREGAASLSWNWTKLRRVANLADLTLVIASHEVEDDGDIDGEMVGEVWQSSYRIEGV